MRPTTTRPSLRGTRAARGRQPARRRAGLPRDGRGRGAARGAPPVRRSRSSRARAATGRRRSAASWRGDSRCRSSSWTRSCTDRTGSRRPTTSSVRRSSRSSRPNGWVDRRRLPAASSATSSSTVPTSSSGSTSRSGSGSAACCAGRVGGSAATSSSGTATASRGAARSGVATHWSSWHSGCTSRDGAAIPSDLVAYNVVRLRCPREVAVAGRRRQGADCHLEPRAVDAT